MKLLFKLTILFIGLLTVSLLTRLSIQVDKLQQVQIQSDTTYSPIYGFKNKKWGVIDSSMTIKTTAVILTKAK